MSSDFPMSPPPTGGPSSSTGKRKRSVDKSPKPSSRTKKSRPSRVRQPRKPKRPSDWHMSRDDVPKEAEKLKVALELHLRVLWNLPDQNAVPPKVTNQDKASFDGRFSSEKQVKTTVTTSLDQNSGSIHDAQVKVEQLLASLPEGSLISNNIKRIAKPFLLLLFRAVASLGLRRWAPDVLSADPESLYNLLHEHIALTTFERVSSAYGYAHTGLILSCIHDFPLMRKLYRNFVFAYMHKIAKSEEKSARINVLKAQGFNKRVVSLALENEAHSDDELGDVNNDTVYFIKEKEGRSTKIKNFFRMVPIDWFDPTYWNTYLTVRERANYIQDGIYVALPMEEFCDSWGACVAWKNLPAKEFMATYGDNVLKQYNIPTKEEMEQLEEWDNKDESDESELSGGDDDGTDDTEGGLE
ncbi:hypothetical protein BDZ94DRAFT_1366458 [Collybia nuda]|uniref:Uncharacterized protein n=1 Tax=Collybia nuda TaxID=64659 RepID=A0A9P5XPV1_9AGAR|nr:hypothetical protein BDZ94DRAFT_1366458 [Collybia nuda]